MANAPVVVEVVEESEEVTLRNPSSKPPILKESRRIAEESAVIEEADGLKATVLNRLRGAFEALTKAEDSLSTGLVADAILSIVPVLSLPNAIRPKSARIAELIIQATGRDARVVKQVKNGNGEVELQPSKVNVYRQFATRYINLARWEARIWNKAELDHQARNSGSISWPTINGVLYESPIAAIRTGCYFTTVHTLFRNALSPTFTDLTDVSESKSERLGRDAVRGFKAAIRSFDAEGRARKAKVEVKGNGAMTHGAILALLEGLRTPMTEKRFSELQAAILKVAPQPTV